MFSIYTDDECFYVGIERGNDNSKKSLKSHIAPYQCCPSTKEKAQARLSVLSDTKLGSSKEANNDITFKFENDDKKSVGKPKGSKLKAVEKPAQSQGERKSKKEERESKKEAAPEKKKRERDVKEKEPRDPKDKDIDKKDKKGKEKKEKGKNTQDDDGDGFFQLGNWW